MRLRYERSRLGFAWPQLKKYTMTRQAIHDLASDEIVWAEKAFAMIGNRILFTDLFRFLGTTAVSLRISHSLTHLHLFSTTTYFRR